MFSEGTYTQSIHNLFTRSHPSEEENRTRNRSKNCKCKRAFTNRVFARLNMQLHTIVSFVCVSLFPIREFEQDNEI